MADIGQLIAKLRKDAGYTQKSLAEALHVTDKAISKWERGLCQPDSGLLPRLSLLLNVDVELLMSKHAHDSTEWVGLLDLQGWGLDLSRTILDKPVAYYILSHFLLAGIQDIYIKTDKKNQAYLSAPLFGELGLRFFFDFNEISGHNIMALNRPLFLFGADMTRQFRSAMAAKQAVKLVPINQKATFVFLPAKNGGFSPEQLDVYYDSAMEKNLGRGVLSIELGSEQSFKDAEVFVRLYQANTGLLLGSLEEIACREGLISFENACETSDTVPLTDSFGGK